MINLTYGFQQNSCSLELAGMPDVSNGDSKNTIGILASWTLQIIGSPLLEGEKEHLDCLMHVILQYSRSYISGIRKQYISNKNIVSITPFGHNHKLLLNSTKDGVSPLEIIIDDSELSDLTQCLDLLRYDTRFNINWNIDLDKPYSKRYIIANLNTSKRNLNLIFGFFVFLSTSALFLLIPIENNIKLKDVNNNNEVSSNLIDMKKLIL